MPFIFDYETFYNYYTDPANLYIDDTPRPNVYFFTPFQIYTGEDLKWDTPHRGVFQIVTYIRPLTN
jgi:hypothetical protein